MGLCRHWRVVFTALLCLLVLALSIAALCTPWLEFDGRIGPFSQRYSVFMYLTKIHNRLTDGYGNRTHREEASYTWAEYSRKNYSEHYNFNVWQTYNGMAACFAFLILGLFFVFIAMILLLACGHRTMPAIVTLAISFIMYIIALCCFFCATHRNYYFPYDGTFLILTYSTGLWLFWVAFFGVIWALTAAIFARGDDDKREDRRHEEPITKAAPVIMSQSVGRDVEVIVT